jgi:hypothetical protein
MHTPRVVIGKWLAIESGKGSAGQQKQKRNKTKHNSHRYAVYRMLTG